MLISLFVRLFELAHKTTKLSLLKNILIKNQEHRPSVLFGSKTSYNDNFGLTNQIEPFNEMYQFRKKLMRAHLKLPQIFKNSIMFIFILNLKGTSFMPYHIISYYFIFDFILQFK